MLPCQGRDSGSESRRGRSRILLLVSNTSPPVPSSSGLVWSRSLPLEGRSRRFKSCLVDRLPLAKAIRAGLTRQQWDVGQLLLTLPPQGNWSGYGLVVVMAELLTCNEKVGVRFPTGPPSSTLLRRDGAICVGVQPGVRSGEMI